mgnify:CR=1 FL=1
MLYTLLAGYHRWPGTDVRGRVEAETALDADLKTALLQALDPDPDRRFQSISRFEAALGAYLERIWPGRAW